MIKKNLTFAALIMVLPFKYTTNNELHSNSVAQFDANMEGTWCVSEEKKLSSTVGFLRFNLVVTILRKNDSIFCRYSNIFNNGKRLNAATDLNDWAFKIPISIFDSSKYIPTLNYNDGSIFHLSLEYNKAHKTLIWKTMENHNVYYVEVPPKVELVKCKAW